MKILQICNDPGIAPDGTKGAAVHLRAVARTLRDLGHQVEMMTARETPRPHELGVTWSALPEAGLPPVLDVDLVYERYALSSRLGLEAAQRSRLPFVLEVNAPLCEETRRYRPERYDPGAEAVEQSLFREATLVTAVSEPLRRYVAERRGTEEGTVVVRNGADPQAPRPGSREDAELVFVGHPKPWHGSERLPRMLRELVARGHEDLRLVIVGGGPGAQRVQDEARREGVADRVEVTGPVTADEVERRLGKATLAVAPYPRHDFFYFCPLKLLEAMASGIPLVTTNQGDLAELVGEAGILVAPDDDDAFIEALHLLLRDPERRAALGAAGRRRVAEGLTWSHAMRTMLAALAEVAPGVGQ